MKNGIKLKDIFAALYKAGQKISTNFEFYNNYKLICLNENSNLHYDIDSFIEGDNIVYVYCGHDSVSHIRNLETEEEIKEIVDYYKSARRYWYFDCVTVVNGVITVH